MDISNQLARLISEQLDLPEDEITMASRLQEDLGADSLDAWEIVMAVEERFDIEIDDRTAAQLQTFGDLVQHVTAAVAAKKGAA